jgi:hypothetical protein
LRFSLTAAYDLGVPEILPRFYRFQQQIEDEKRIAKLILEGEAVELPTRTAAGGTAAGDPRRLRFEVDSLVLVLVASALTEAWLAMRARLKGRRVGRSAAPA